MSRLAKSEHQDSNRRYFVEEQMVAGPMLVLMIAVMATIGGSDIVTRRGDHFLLLLPETDAQGASRVGQRLARVAARRWGLDLHCGVSSFPEKEVTFDGLITQAESQMRGEDAESLNAAAERRGGASSSAREAAAPEANPAARITSSPQPGT